MLEFSGLVQPQTAEPSRNNTTSGDTLLDNPARLSNRSLYRSMEGTSTFTVPLQKQSIKVKRGAAQMVQVRYLLYRARLSTSKECTSTTKSYDREESRHGSNESRMNINSTAASIEIKKKHGSTHLSAPLTPVSTLCLRKSEKVDDWIQ